MDREKVAKFLGMMAEHFPSFQFSEDTVTAWLMVLGSYESGEVLEAYQEFLPSGSAFAPSISQIVKILEDRKMILSWTKTFKELDDARKRN